MLYEGPLRFSFYFRTMALFSQKQLFFNNWKLFSNLNDHQLFIWQAIKYWYTISQMTNKKPSQMFAGQQKSNNPTTHWVNFILYRPTSTSRTAEASPLSTSVVRTDTTRRAGFSFSTVASLTSRTTWEHIITENKIKLRLIFSRTTWEHNQVR